MSRLRPDEARIRTFALTIAETTLAPPQPAGFEAFVTVNAGVVTMTQEARRRFIDSATGVFAASGTPFALTFDGRCELRIVYVCESLGLAKPGSLHVNRLLRALIERAASAGYLDPAVPREANLLDVLEDELRALEAAPAARALTLPADVRLRAAAELFLSADDRVTIAAAAAYAGMTARTFDRAFLRETGMTPRAWRAFAGLERAHAALTVGASVTDAGLACGYASTSAFIAAYRAAFGRTPGRVRPRSSQPR